MWNHMLNGFILFFICLIIAIFAQCEKGRFGDSCEQNCPEGCAPDTNVIQCDQKSGICLDGCSPGWYGDHCRKVCSSHCSKNICNQHDGRCTQGCVEGMRGKLCEQALEKHDGNCSGKKWGESCEFNCTVGCVDNSCNTTNGKCLLGCTDGYCDNPSCQQCATTLTSAGQTHSNNIPHFNRYISTFVVVSVVPSSLMICVCATALIYFKCIRPKTCIVRRTKVRQTSILETDLNMSENVNARMEPAQGSAGDYSEINENEMEDAIARPKACFPTMNVTENEFAVGNRISGFDSELAGGYEPIDNLQLESSICVISSPREQAEITGAYYLTANLNNENNA